MSTVSRNNESEVSAKKVQYLKWINFRDFRQIRKNMSSRKLQEGQFQKINTR